MRYLRIPFAVFLLSSAIIWAQTPTATINGRVLDPTRAVIPGASVDAINVDTNAQHTVQTNGNGLYTIVNLLPGNYRVEISKPGFRTIVKPDVLLHVQDVIALNFDMSLGSTSETVTVEGGASLVNTQDATVSTVIDRNFAENLPMNGRSFQTLIALTPGVVITATSASEQGQFSVNGQRADANYITVDGASANASASPNLALLQTVGGSIPAFSAQGGTNGLVSIDAMQEFKIQTSSFAPEFGRTPGAQVSIITRAGTNKFHGTLFEYLRNDALDANDWFANHNHLPKPKERQNDFGGVFGGPLLKDRTFFFFSYEGLRLRQPQTQVTTVPNTISRQAASTGIQPILNAFPISNGPDFGNGFAQFQSTYSDSATLDAYSFRLDHALNTKLSLFGRYAYTPSESINRVPSILSDNLVTSVATHTLTLGITELISRNVSNEVRLNYTNSRGGSKYQLDNLGGAVPLTNTIFPSGFSSETGLFSFGFAGTPALLNFGKNSINEQRQVNFVDGLSITIGSHQLKMGADYRWLAPISSPRPYAENVIFSGISGPKGVLSGIPSTAQIVAFQSAAFLSQNISLYGQDTWKLSPTLALTYGLRWDVNPAPRGKNAGSDPFTVDGLDSPPTITLAPRGTPIYETTYGNVSPRLGVAYQLRRSQDWGAAFRGGFGVFYDLGSGSLGSLNGGFPFTIRKPLTGVPFPFNAAQAAPPAFSLNPPVSSIFLADRHLNLPRSYQWNTSFEQALGSNQVFSTTYVGAVGRDLLRQDVLLTPNPNFVLLDVTRNTATSDYHALQVKFQRRLSRGLQALGSYSWSHSIDIASNDSFTLNSAAVAASPLLDRGDSDFDIRNSFSGALTYVLPSLSSQPIVRKILDGWAIDSLFIARSANPVSISATPTAVAGTQFVPRPNVNPGVPLYLFSSSFPGGKQLNKSAFANPPSGQQGNFRRNSLREFGAWQENFALRRQFHVTEGFALQFRVEFFNLFNHPNFGNPTPANLFLTSNLFGQTTQTLASSLGTGGVNGGLTPLYQTGGPRSIQVALKLTF